MGKESYSAVVGNEQGRINNLRLDENKKIVGTFTGIGCTSGRVVCLNEVRGANNKAAKKIQAEVETIQKKAEKLKNKASTPGERLIPCII